MLHSEKIELRKWCLEQANRMPGKFITRDGDGAIVPDPQQPELTIRAQSIFDWLVDRSPERE